MKPMLLIALVLVSSGSAAQTGGSYDGNRNDLARMPESGPLVVPGGGATTGPNYRNLSVSPPAGQPRGDGRDHAPAQRGATPDPGDPPSSRASTAACPDQAVAHYLPPYRNLAAMASKVANTGSTA